MNHPGSKHHADHHGKGEHSHTGGEHPPGWQRHSKWFVLAVVLMLLGIGIYVVTLDEEIRPPDGVPGEAERMPAAEAP